MCFEHYFNAFQWRTLYIYLYSEDGANGWVTALHKDTSSVVFLHYSLGQGES